MNQPIYKIPDNYFFRLHHVRPRFKNDVEEVLLYVANAISDMPSNNSTSFNDGLNKVLRGFQGNANLANKTIDNWRTEISAIFAFIQEEKNISSPTLSAKRLAENQYLDEFFNYFLFTFQYPAGHVKSQSNIKVIEAGIKFKPCNFVLNLLVAGGKITGKPFSITAEELTQCAYYDLRVTRDHLAPSIVAQKILDNRKNKIEYSYDYEQLIKDETHKTTHPKKSDFCRYAGDILDYMVLANILTDKGTGFYYYLNTENNEAIQHHLNNINWFDGYDAFYGKPAHTIKNSQIFKQEESWVAYVNSFFDIKAFEPKLDEKTVSDISNLIKEYYYQQASDKKISTKMIGDFGESLVIVHEFLRTKNLSNRQHLINKIPTPLAVGYDIQSIEIEKGKRYIEVKTTKSNKALKNNSFKLTPNEWDSAETLGNNYYIYYLAVNNKSKRVFIIKNPIELLQHNKISVDNHLVVKFNEKSGEWIDLLEMQH